MKTPKNKLRARYMLFCDYAIISQDGKISLMGEFDRVFSTEDAAFLGRAYLVSKILGEADQGLDLEVSLTHEESKEVLFKNNLAVKLDNRGVAALMIELNGVRFNKFGVYKAAISFEGNQVAEMELEVVKVKPPNVGQS
jgi:hypothetical protein